MKKIKVELSEKGINELIEKLESLQKGSVSSMKATLTDLARLGENEIAQNIASSQYTDAEIPVTFQEGDLEKLKYTVGMKGTQAIYDEFGTGTIGKFSEAHPARNTVKGVVLNDFNSGKTIRPKNAPDELKYWTYSYNGKIVRTQGIPAGKQVYNASLEVRKEVINFSKQRLGDVISKL